MVVTLDVRQVLPAGARARIVRLDLAGRRFPYSAGQAVLVASHGFADRRPYSLATAPEDARRTGYLELLVSVDERAEAGPHLALAVGERVDVEGPIGQFVFHDDTLDRPLVFIAGGSGIAPLRAMLRHALEMPGRRIGVLYSVRRSGDFAYEAELREFATRGLIDLSLTVTREHGDGHWTGSHGRLAREDIAPLLHDQRARCFICGPPALVEEMPKLLMGLGIPSERIHVERW